MMVMGAKCRQCRPPFSQSFSTECRCQKRRRKSSGHRLFLRAATRPCPLFHSVLFAVTKNSRNSFFAQAAALSTLRLPRNFKPAQRSFRQRSRQHERPRDPRPARVLFQSRPARRLWRHFLSLPGRRFATSHLHGHAALEVALPMAGCRFNPGGGGTSAAADLSPGNDLSFARPPAPAAGCRAQPVMSRAETARQFPV